MPSARKISNPKLVEEKLIVKYKSELFDITNFISKHPGGVNTLYGYNQKNIEEKFHSVEHSPAAKYLLNEYKINTQQLETGNEETDESMEVREEVTVVRLESWFCGSFQHLIDWTTAVLPQISALGDRYSAWVNKPVDRKLILFNNPILESLSKVRSIALAMSNVTDLWILTDPLVSAFGVLDSDDNIFSVERVDEGKLCE